MSITAKSTKKKSLIYIWNQWIIPIIISIFLAIIINNFVVFKIKIPSESMAPTLNIGDRLLAYRIYNTKNLSRGDLVVFKYKPQGKLFIKRLIGLPNDEIIINNGVVSVNGEMLEENYIENNMLYNGRFKVPEDSYFFLGDNRNNSFDSRFWDYPYIASSDIRGKAFLKVYPFNEVNVFK